MLEFDKEKVDKCLYDYKYGKVTLENTIKDLLNCFGLKSSCLYALSEQEVATDLAEYLTKYKFNRFIYGYNNFFTELTEFLNNNKYRFGLQYKTDTNFEFDNDR